MNNITILAIDYGSKTTGVAVVNFENENWSSVLKLPEIKTKSWKHLTHEIKKVVSDFKVSKILLGNPLNKIGNDTEMSVMLKRFKKYLEQSVTVDIEFENEYASTKESKGEASIHSTSAQVILERYILKFQD